MSHSTHTHRRHTSGRIGAVALLAIAYALLLGFIWLVGTAPLLAGIVAVIVGAALTALYIRLGRTQ